MNSLVCLRLFGVNMNASKILHFRSSFISTLGQLVPNVLVFYKSIDSSVLMSIEWCEHSPAKVVVVACAPSER